MMGPDQSGGKVPTGLWHLDEMMVSIAGRRMYLWRVVDDKGVVLDVLDQGRRNTAAPIKLLRTPPDEPGVLHSDHIWSPARPSAFCALYAVVAWKAAIVAALGCDMWGIAWPMRPNVSVPAT